jgi:hypothetical protein
MDRAGFLFLGLALFVFVAQNKLTQRTASQWDFSGAWVVLIVLPAFWISGTLGALLLLGRQLLQMQWWYSWIAFLAVGVLLWTDPRDLVGDSASRYPFRFDDFALMLVGIASTIMGFIFLVAQWLVRRTPRENSRTPR